MTVEATSKGVILIVDDTPTNLELLFNCLANSGFKVLVAEDGKSALQTVEYALPDLILLDVLMPGIDGFETCRYLKANELTKDIPVIFMTALSETVDKVTGLALGAVDYITKPLQQEVLARVNLHLNLWNLTKTLREQNLRLEHLILEIEQIGNTDISQINRNLHRYSKRPLSPFCQCHSTAPGTDELSSQRA